MSNRNIHRDISQGTSHVNTTTEGNVAQYAFAANAWQVGQRYDFACTVRVIDTNSTDTLVIKARLGGTTLTGTVIATSATVDVADADIAVITGSIYVTAVGSAGTADTHTSAAGPDALAVATALYDAATVASLDTTAILYLEITADWSVAHADNECAAFSFTVDEIV